MGTLVRRFGPRAVTFVGDCLVEGGQPLGTAVLVVEAGTVTEVLVAVEPPGEQPVTITVQSLPEAWHTLATPHIREKAAEAVLALHPPHGDLDAPIGDYSFSVVVGTDDGEETIPGRLRLLPPGGLEMRSRYLYYLPDIYRDRDPFIARFLLIFQSIMDPIERQIDTTDLYLNPALAPARFLPWLARWVGIGNTDLDDAQLRDLIQRTAEMSVWKGTRRGLKEALELATGCKVLITENFDGLRLGQDAALGVTTGVGTQQPGVVNITIVANAGTAPDAAYVERIVTEHEPVHVKHNIRILTTAGAKGDTSA